MAKQIKVIKCPQCGSTNNTQLSVDRYKCNNCDAEYFLDNDDVNVNVNYSYKDGNTSDSKRIVKWVLIGIFSFFIFSTLVSTCISVFSSRSSDTRSYNTYSSSSNTSKKEEVKESIDYANLFVNNKQEPILFAITYTDGKDSKRNYLGKYIDLKSKKNIGSTKLDITKLDKYELRTFNDGNTYIVINKKLLYRLNMTDLTLDNVTESMFKEQSLLSSGLASIEFVRDSWGDGFNVITNLGKEYYFYPMVGKVYTKDAFFDAVFGFNNLLPGAKNVTYYEMTSRSDDFEDEPIQLLEIVYKYNNGGPEEKDTSPRWYKDYGGSGIFTDRSPYTKRLFRNTRNRIVSYKDVTPGRTYFAASVKYFDDKNIIISFRPTVAEDAPRILQCLSIPSFEVLWSLNLELDSKYDPIKSLVKTKDGYVVQTNKDTYLEISNSGKLEKTIKL